jgi:hypothetical protein
MNMKKDIAVIGVLALIILAGAILFSAYSGGRDAIDGVKDMGREQGMVTLAIGQSAKFGTFIITPLEVLEDSRCAEGVQCIWAGTVRVKLRTVSGLGTSEQAIELGKSMTTEAEEVRFASVSPARKEGVEVRADDYRFTFEVRRRSVDDTNPPVTETPVSSGKCYVGGCSGQICSDQEGMASTCEFRAEYACYKTAKCERQVNGQCGWTSTQELQMCLSNPPQE